MARCTAVKPDGTPCERIVGASQSHCYSHDPSRQAERKRNASRAARSRPNTEVKGIKDALVALADDVLKGKINRGDAAVVNQILNTRLRALSLERDLREHDELEKRLTELERHAERVGTSKGGSRWPDAG